MNRLRRWITGRDFFEYYNDYGGSWSPAPTPTHCLDVPADGVGDNYTWVFNSGTNWDWRTEVREAEQNDLFDLAHAGEDL